MISPIMNNGIVTQTQNVNIINNNDENRTAVNYQQVLTNVETETETASRVVISSSESTETDTRHDARDEGKNKYVDLRDKSKKKVAAPEGFVRKSNMGGFDLKI